MRINIPMRLSHHSLKLDWIYLNNQTCINLVSCLWHSVSPLSRYCNQNVTGQPHYSANGQSLHFVCAQSKECSARTRPLKRRYIHQNSHAEIRDHDGTRWGYVKFFVESWWNLVETWWKTSIWLSSMHLIFYFPRTDHCAKKNSNHHANLPLEIYSFTL